MSTYEIYIKNLKTFLINYNSAKILKLKNQKTEKNIKKFKYLERIQFLVNYNKILFEFDLEDLSDKSFPKEIKWLFLSNTKRFLTIMKQAINEIIQEIKPNVSFFSDNFGVDKIFFSKSHKKFPKYQIIIKPNFKSSLISLKSIKADLVGKFIFLKGIIVNLSKVKIIIQKAVYLCSLCNLKLTQEPNGENFKPFFCCPSKKCTKEKSGNNLFLDTNLTIFEKFQEITICENFSNDNLNLNDSFLKIKLFGELIGDFKTGESIEAAGILLPSHLKSGAFNNFIENISMEAYHIRKNFLPIFNINKPLNIEKKILELFKKKNIYSVISESFAPFVFGNLDIKKVLILSILSKSLNFSNEFSIDEENINILILGETGTAKTKLLKFVSHITPISIYRNGINLSPKNFFSESFSNETIEKLSEKNFLETRSTPKIVCLDDLHKIKEKDVFFLGQILKKKQNYQFEKNQKKEINFSNSIIAAGTLEEGFFDQTFRQMNNRTFFTLFSEFHLIFLLSEVKEKFYGNNLAKHVIFCFKKNQSSFLNSKKLEIPILRSYLIEAQQIYPLIPTTFFDFLIYNYIMWRSHDREDYQNQLCIKTFTIIIRFSVALARLKFQKFVSKNDIVEAIRLIETSKKSINKFPTHTFKIQKEKIETKIYSFIRDLSMEFKHSELDLSRLEKLILKKGFSREEFVNCLGHYEELNIWKLSIFSGKLIFSK